MAFQIKFDQLSRTQVQSRRKEAAIPPAQPDIMEKLKSSAIELPRQVKREELPKWMKIICYQRDYFNGRALCHRKNPDDGSRVHSWWLIQFATQNPLGIHLAIVDKKLKNGIVWGSAGRYNGIDDLAVHCPYDCVVWDMEMSTYAKALWVCGSGMPKMCGCCQMLFVSAPPRLAQWIP